MPEKTKVSTPLIGTPGLLVALLVILIFERTVVWGLMQEQLEQVLFLDSFLLISLFLGILYWMTGKKNILKNIFGEVKSVRDGVGDIIIGVAIGLAFAFISFSDPGLSTLTTAIAGDYQPMNALPGLNQARLSFTSAEASPLEHYILNAILNFFHVGMNEEIVMAVITGGILALLGVPMGREALAHPMMPVGILSRGLFFGGFFHFIAYTGGLEYFSLSYFIPAFLGGVLFGVLLLWRGIVAAVVAHASYNTAFAAITATGFSPLNLLIAFVALAVGGSYFLYREYSDDIQAAVGGIVR